MTAQDLTLEQIASDAIQQALAGGATDAECTISEGEEFSVSVRMQEVENLKEAGSRGASREADRRCRNLRDSSSAQRSAGENNTLAMNAKHIPATMAPTRAISIPTRLFSIRNKAAAGPNRIGQ